MNLYKFFSQKLVVLLVVCKFMNIHKKCLEAMHMLSIIVSEIRNERETVAYFK